MTHLIWSNEKGAWWKPSSLGYTAIISEAGRYSHEEAAAICERANRWREGKEPHEVAVLAPESVDALEAENQQLRGLLSDVVSVAITMLYSSHKDDTLATFSVPELNDVVARSEHLQPERVEHIYRRGYEALAAGGVK